MTDSDEIAAWVKAMTPGDLEQFDADKEAEAAKVIQAQPARPADTSDEVLGENYRHAQAQAIVNLWRSHRKLQPRLATLGCP